MNHPHSQATDNLFKAILTLETVEECYNFFEDACTIKEIIEIAQRFEVAGLLKQGVSYAQISKETGASTATISRVNRIFSYGNDSLKLLLGRVEEQRGEAE